MAFALVKIKKSAAKNAMKTLWSYVFFFVGFAFFFSFPDLLSQE